jgi:hypothetical protein
MNHDRIKCNVKLIIDKTTNDWGDALEDALERAGVQMELPHKAPKPNSRKGKVESGLVRDRRQRGHLKESNIIG